MKNNYKTITYKARLIIAIDSPIIQTPLGG